MNKKNILRFIGILIYLVCILIYILNNKTYANEKLILVTEAGFAPYEYYSKKGITGVDIEIAQEIAKKLGKDLEIKDIAFDSLISEVKTGKSDIGAAGISYTKEREKEVDFTIDYAQSKQVVIVHKNSNINNVNEITKKVAVQLGSVADSIVTEKFKNLEVVREKKFLAAIEDLKKNKVEAVIMDELPAKKLLTKELKILNNPIATDNYGMIVNKKNKELLNVANQVISELKAEGKIDELILKHIELAEENTENLTLKEKIENTLLKNERYKYILDGLKNTIILAIGAIFLGILIGSIIAIINNYNIHTGKLKILNFLGKCYVNIIRGTPSTLQLMIIYYVIFANVDTNIILVGITAFGINSGAYVAEIIRAGFSSVDQGEIEAGYSLSLNYSKVMRYIVFPQAIKNILPALSNEFITLIKETSIGAYIGILDLTKSSDIIASRTYDYFLPLLIVAIIYLILTMCLSKLSNILERKLNNVRIKEN